MAHFLTFDLYYFWLLTFESSHEGKQTQSIVQAQRDITNLHTD